MTMSLLMSTTSNAGALSASQLVSFAAVVAMLGLVSYAGGRVHQYFKQGVEREQAFRDGYNTASRDLFALATRVAKTGIEAPPPLEQPPPLQQPTHAMKMTPPGGQPKVRRRARSRHGVDTGELSSFQQAVPPTAWERYRGVAEQG